MDLGCLSRVPPGGLRLPWRTTPRRNIDKDCISGKFMDPSEYVLPEPRLVLRLRELWEPHFAELAQNPRDELLHTELSSRTATTASVQPSSAMSSIGRVASGHRSEREG